MYASRVSKVQTTVMMKAFLRCLLLSRVVNNHLLWTTSYVCVYGCTQMDIPDLCLFWYVEFMFRLFSSSADAVPDLSKQKIAVSRVIRLCFSCDVSVPILFVFYNWDNFLLYWCMFRCHHRNMIFRGRIFRDDHSDKLSETLSHIGTLYSVFPTRRF